MGNHNTKRRALILAVALMSVILTVNPFGTGVALAASARALDSSVTQILATLYKKKPDAKALGDKAVAALVFPKIVKGGFVIGGQYGDGALRKHGQTVAYYRSVAASYGFQAGVQTFGYVLFFMDEPSVQYLDKSGGWELGTGPTLVVADEGFGKTASTTTLQKGVYAFIFNQKGLMGGTGIQGTKITKINPNP
jgi:lipid-binding SYLF domain-containing protein